MRFFVLLVFISFQIGGFAQTASGEVSTRSDNKLHKNCISIDLVSSIYMRQPTIYYERFLNKKFSIAASGGYKFPSGPTIIFLYQGHRESLVFRYHFKEYLFIGVKAGYSSLAINDRTLSSSPDPNAGYYSHYKSKREDLDFGLTFGVQVGEIFESYNLAIFLNGGIRRVAGKTSYTYLNPGELNVGGFVLGYRNPVLNGNITIPFIELGVAIGKEF